MIGVGSAYRAIPSNWESLCDELLDRCMREYGGIFATSRDRLEAAAQHFQKCPDDECIDFLEMLFESDQYRLQQHGVEALNAIFREEGIGYEFTPYVVTETRREEDGRIYSSYEIEHPKAIKKSDEQTHEKTVLPALQILSKARFKNANQELLEAFEHFRHGRFDDSNTSCGRAMESVLKIICAAKKWKHDPVKDTLATLVDICHANGLFPPFYADTFKGNGTIRNKIGAHGKGAGPIFPNDEVSAEHMIQLTCSHILFLVRRSGL